MKQGNILIVILLLIFAGTIIALSFYFTLNIENQKPKEIPTQMSLHPIEQKEILISEKLEKSFNRGLDWLIKQQEKNGDDTLSGINIM